MGNCRRTLRGVGFCAIAAWVWRRCRWRRCSVARRVLSVRRPATFRNSIRLRRRRRIQGEGQAGDLSVHGRSAEPFGVVRLQAAVGEIRRHHAAAGVVERLSRGVHRSEIEVAGSQIQICQAWAMRRRDFGTAAAPGRGDRRCDDREIADDRCVQSCAGANSNEHRRTAIRPTQHGRLDALRPGF